MATPLTKDESQARTESWDRIREHFALLSESDRRAVVVASARRMMPLMAVRLVQKDMQKILSILDEVVAGGIDDAGYEKRKKRISALRKVVSKEAGYDRKTRLFADHAAHACAEGLTVVSYCCSEWPPSAALPFAWSAVEYAGGGQDGAREEVRLQWKDVRHRAETSADFESWPASIDAMVRDLVPPQGPAATLHGELVRCVTGLTDEGLRNGNVNFGDRHRIMVAFIRQCLLDDKVFDGAQRSSITAELFDLHKGTILSTVGYRILARATVRWCRSTANGVLPAHLGDNRLA